MKIIQQKRKYKKLFWNMHSKLNLCEYYMYAFLHLPLKMRLKISKNDIEHLKKTGT